MNDTVEPQDLVETKFHVLLVEDQPIIQVIHSNFLQTLECSVNCAANGTEALAFLKDAKQYDIVFMDMGLPDISGIEVVKTYRQQEKEKKYHLPIIALTAYGGKDDKQKFLEAGVDEVVVKPVTIQQLHGVLLKYIEKASKSG